MQRTLPKIGCVLAVPVVLAVSTMSVKPALANERVDDRTRSVSQIAPGTERMAEAWNCKGIAVNPNQNLAAVAASKPAGTTFCLGSGTYKVSSPVVVGNGDRCWGVT